VSPLRGFICVLNAFSQLPLWATLSRASGTLDNTKLEHHHRGVVFAIQEVGAEAPTS
jgi:hypothetical protein